MPTWVKLWCSVSYCSQWDLCWLTLFTRARKHVDVTEFDWKSLIPVFLLKVRELMILPVARVPTFSSDSFPFVFPSYYQYIVGNCSSASQTSLIKLAKLLYFACICDYKHLSIVSVEPLTITPPSLVPQSAYSSNIIIYPGYNVNEEILSSVAEIVYFFQSIRPYFYASNGGSWANNVSYFVGTLTSEVSRHIGRSIAYNLLGKEDGKDGKGGKLSPHRNTSVNEANGGSKYAVFEAPIHKPTVKYLVGLLTLLSIEGLYGKSNVAAQCYALNMKNLCTIDPMIGHIILPFLLAALGMITICFD